MNESAMNLLFIQFTENAGGVYTKVHLTYWTRWIFLSLRNGYKRAG